MPVLKSMKIFSKPESSILPKLHALLWKMLHQLQVCYYHRMCCSNQKEEKEPKMPMGPGGYGGEWVVCTDPLLLQ